MWCCSEYRYPQSSLKQKVPILFWLSGLMTETKGYAGFSQLFSGSLGERGVHMTASQHSLCWGVLLSDTIQNTPLTAVCFTFFSLDLVSTYCVPSPALGNRVRREARKMLVPQCEKETMIKSLLGLPCVRENLVPNKPKPKGIRYSMFGPVIQGEDFCKNSKLLEFKWNSRMNATFYEISSLQSQGNRLLLTLNFSLSFYLQK